MKDISFLAIALAFGVSIAFAESEYTGTIKSIYYHDRDIGNDYIGVELNGNMSSNPCGNTLTKYIIDPKNLNDRHFSMLLSAHLAGREVKIVNSGATPEKKCNGVYSTFNLIQIL